MNDGVGRQGYRVLASVIASVGAVGLIAAIYAFRPGGDLFHWLGFGLLVAALVGLLAVTLVVLNREIPAPGQAAPTATPQAQTMQVTPAPTMKRARATPVETPAQEIKVERMRTVGAPIPPSGKPLPRPERKTPTPTMSKTDAIPEEGIEFDDAKPAARAAPTEVVVPPAFKDEAPAGAEAAKDPKAWPERRAPAGNPAQISLGTMQARAAQTLNAGTPTVMAKVWYTQSTLPRGWAKGRCGDCGTQLMAPPERPINLRCPQCDKITLMS